MNENVTGWRKSSRSGGQTNCVEVGHVACGGGNGAAVRDTKDRAAGYFTASESQWASFMSAIKAGRYDS